MTLQQLNYVITVSETGSLSRAADRLYLSQPTLTSAIHDLEKELEFQIFNRSRRGVTLTAAGAEFLPYARQVFGQYLDLMEQYGLGKDRKLEFAVSTQHYTFAVKAFVELMRRYDTSEYHLALRETRTLDVIRDVASLRSEIGILYLDDFNRKAILHLLADSEVVFHLLTRCDAYVYLWRGHPLAGRTCLEIQDLEPFPCISFEQGAQSSFYMAEELLCTYEYSRVIKVCDRATVLNLMVGLNGYTLCSGIICEELNGEDYIAIPLRMDAHSPHGAMEIGYITRQNTTLSRLARDYIEKLKTYLALAVPEDSSEPHCPMKDRAASPCSSCIGTPSIPIIIQEGKP